MEVLVLNTEFESVAIIDTFESLIWTDRYYEAGDFEIYTAATTDMLRTLQPDYYLWCKESEHMMVVEGVEIKSDFESGNKLIVTGRSLESILDRRIIWGQTNIDDTLQNGIKKLLNENIINPSDTNRQINNFIFEESSDINIQSMFLQTQYFGENLYEAIVDICKSNSIGFKITLNESNQFVFKLYFGVDRTYNQIEYPAVIFSNNFDNLINSDYVSSKKDFKTLAFVAGDGEGDERFDTSIGIDGNYVGINRREIFTNANGTSRKSDDRELTDAEYTAQLQQKGMEDLSEHIMTESFEGEISSLMFAYDEHYYMGDIVEVANEYGNESEPRIIEYIYSQSNNELKYYPTFGYDEYDSAKYRNEDKFLVQVYDLDIDETYPTNEWCDSTEPILERYFTYEQIAVNQISSLWKNPSIMYTCRLSQYVYAAQDMSITTRVNVINRGSLYLNDTLVTVVNGTTSTIILNLYAGWNKIDIVFTNDTGLGHGYLTDNIYGKENILHAVPEYRKVRIT